MNAFLIWKWHNLHAILGRWFLKRDDFLCVELKGPLPVLQLMSLPFQTQLTNAKEQLKQQKSLLWPYQNNHPATLLLQKCAIWMPRLITFKSSSFCSLWTCPYNTPILFSLLFVFLCVDKSITYTTPLEEKKQHIPLLCAVASDSGTELGCK